MSASPELSALLHVAARRRCMERHAEWSAIYQAMSEAGAGYNPTSRTYSLRARAVFPRYLQLHAMQVELERLEPDALGSLAEARTALIAACERARIANPAVEDDPIAIPAFEEERALLVEFLATVDDDLLWRVRPLPYRRVLAADELAALTPRVTARFGTWYGGACDRALTCAHRTYDLPLQPAPAAVLRPLLPARVYEWNEIDESVVQDTSAVGFERAEAYWFSAELTWLVYASHEATLTIAGDALVPAVERSAPGWRART